MLEIWKPIKNYEGLYEVSNLGKVKSLSKRKGFIETTDIVLKPRNIKGYLSVHLSKKGITKNLLIHRLVALAFIPNPEDKPEVNHIDGNKKNNCVSNLEWVTKSENDLHAYKLGLRRSPMFWKNKKSQEHCRSVKIRCIETKEIFNSITEAQLKYNTSHISGCLKGRRKSCCNLHWEVI